MTWNLAVLPLVVSRHTRLRRLWRRLIEGATAWDRESTVIYDMGGCAVRVGCLEEENVGQLAV